MDYQSAAKRPRTEEAMIAPGVASASGVPSSTVFCHNIPRGFTNENLLQLFAASPIQPLFATPINFPDGKVVGRAFVRFPSHEAAQAALATVFAVPGQDRPGVVRTIMGIKMELSGTDVKNPQGGGSSSSVTPYASNPMLAYSALSPEALSMLQAGYGTAPGLEGYTLQGLQYVQSSGDPSQPIAYAILQADPSHLLSAARAGTDRPPVDYETLSSSSCTLFVHSIPPGLGLEYVLQIFAAAPEQPIGHTQLNFPNPAKPGRCHVKFSSNHAARDAFNMVDGRSETDKKGRMVKITDLGPRVEFSATEVTNYTPMSQSPAGAIYSQMLAMQSMGVPAAYMMAQAQASAPVPTSAPASSRGTNPNHISVGSGQYDMSNYAAAAAALGVSVPPSTSPTEHPSEQKSGPEERITGVKRHAEDQ